MDEGKSVMSEFAIASLVIGVTSLITLAGMEKAVVAIVFGILALKKIKRENQLLGKNLALAGIILGVLSIIFTMIFLIKFFPRIQQQAQSQYNLMQKDRVPSDKQQFELIPPPK